MVLLFLTFSALVANPKKTTLHGTNERKEPNQIGPGTTRSEQKSRESRQKETDKKVTSKGHRRQEGQRCNVGEKPTVITVHLHYQSTFMYTKTDAKAHEAPGYTVFIYVILSLVSGCHSINNCRKYYLVLLIVT